jgi:hypothetical protein
MNEEERGRGSLSPKDDSGYGSEAMEVWTAVREKEQRTFKQFLDALIKSESSAVRDYEEKQHKLIDILDRYYEANIPSEEKVAIREKHFKILDIAINSDSLSDSSLKNNEGSAFLAVARSTTSYAVLCRLIYTISVEKSKPVAKLLEEYVDKDGENVLHALANSIANKRKSNCPIFPEDWDAYHYFAELVPKLKNSKSHLGLTPKEIFEVNKIEVPTPRDVKIFKALTDALSNIELSNRNYKEKQHELMRILDEYYKANIPTGDDSIKQRKYFQRLDIAIKNTLPTTNLDGNEGSTFLALARSTTNETVLRKWMETISVEKGRSVDKLLEEYVDVDGENVLHALAGCLVKKHENGYLIFPEDWKTYHHFTKLVSSLAESKDLLLERTPEEVITESTDLEVPPSDSDDMDLYCPIRIDIDVAGLFFPKPK